jgi:hypothetical protein
MLGKLNYYATKVSIFLIMAALIAGMPSCDGYTPSQNLEIQDWYDLDAVRYNLAGNHILMNDLDCTTPGYEELASPTANAGKGWQPIKSFSEKSLACFRSGGVAPWWDGLTGTFDGQGYEIRDLFINRPDEELVGLFGAVDRGGIIKNVGVVDVTVTSETTVGGLAGWNYYGTVRNSYSSGNVTGKYNIGGLLGENYYGTVSNSYSSGNVTGVTRVGGLVGEDWYGTVGNSYYTGSVTGNYDVGGLVGMNYESGGTVSNSFWDTETSGQATSDGGTGKTTAEMKDIATFSGAGWNIITVALNQTNPTYIWNIVDNVTYPFLSWQS